MIKVLLFDRLSVNCPTGLTYYLARDTKCCKSVQDNAVFNELRVQKCDEPFATPYPEGCDYYRNMQCALCSPEMCHYVWDSAQSLCNWKIRT